MKPYYEDGTVTIYHGDCLDVLGSLDPQSVDLTFTSPPYNLGRDNAEVACERGLWKRGARAGGLANGYASHDDAMPQDEYEAWQREVLAACWRVTAGAIFYNHKPRVLGGALWTPLVLNPGLPLRQIVVWDRGSGFNFTPTNYRPDHEWIVVMARPAFRLATRGASGVGDVWRINATADPDHPAPFPLDLPLRAIETTGAKTVLDPFMGSGTTLRAAKDLGRRAIGIEKEERYCELAARRMGQEVFDLGEAA